MIDRIVYLARHGQTIYGTKPMFIGHTDVELSDTGRAQIGFLGEQLKSINLSAIYTSPLLRTRETAKAVAAARDLEPIIVEGLKEINLGQWEDLSIEEIEERWPAEYASRRNDIENFAPPEGESWGTLRKRANAAFAEILESAPPGPIFIAGHFGVNTTIICELMDLPTEVVFNIGQEYGCLNILEFREGSGNIRLMNWTGPGSLEDVFEPEDDDD